MKSLSKLTVSIVLSFCILASVVALSFAVGAEDDIVSTDPSSSQQSSTVTSRDESTSSADTSSSDTTSNSSDFGQDDSSTQSSTTSRINSQTTVSVISSQRNYSSKTPSTSSKRGSVGGTISDGIDTSGWGTGSEDQNSSTQSVGMAGEKANDKKMFNLAKLLWILIWIPIALIIASIAALIHVNKPSFLGKTASAGNAADKGTHTYKKNDGKGAARKKSKKKNVYRPHD